MLVENPALNSWSRSGALVVGGSAFRLGPLQSPPAPSFNHATDKHDKRKATQRKWLRNSGTCTGETDSCTGFAENMPSNSKLNRLLEQFVAKQLGSALIQGSDPIRYPIELRRKNLPNDTWKKNMSGTLKCYFTVSRTVSPKSGKKPFGMYAAIEKFPGANFPSKQSRPNRKRPFLWKAAQALSGCEAKFFIEVKSTSFRAPWSWRLQLRPIRFEYKSKISNLSWEQSIESMFLFPVWSPKEPYDSRHQDSLRKIRRISMARPDK